MASRASSWNRRSARRAQQQRAAWLSGAAALATPVVLPETGELGSRLGCRPARPGRARPVLAHREPGGGRAAAARRRRRAVVRPGFAALPHLPGPAPGRAARGRHRVGSGRRGRRRGSRPRRAGRRPEHPRAAPGAAERCGGRGDGARQPAFRARRRVRQRVPRGHRRGPVPARGTAALDVRQRGRPVGAGRVDGHHGHVEHGRARDAAAPGPLVADGPARGAVRRGPRPARHRASRRRAWPASTNQPCCAAATLSPRRTSCAAGSRCASSIRSCWPRSTTSCRPASGR